jgi:hypothetical protein
MSRLGNGLKSDRYASISYAPFIDSMKIISSTPRGVAGTIKDLVLGSFHEAESQDGLNPLVARHRTSASFLAFSVFNANKVCWYCNEFHRSEPHHA